MIVHAEDIHLEDVADLIAELFSKIEDLEEQIRELENHMEYLTPDRD
jgi:archaellum component FlaC